MKVSIKVLAITFALLFANLSIANNTNPGFMTINSEDKIINFSAKNILSNEFEISFEDQSGEVMFNEYGVNPATFERKYNLSEMPEGWYILVIKENSKIQKVSILIDSEGLKVDLDQLQAIQYATN